MSASAMPVLTSRAHNFFNSSLWMDALRHLNCKNNGCTRIPSHIWALNFEEKRKKISKVCENKVGKSGIEKFSGTPGKALDL